MAETMNIQTDVALIWGHCPIGSFRHWQVGLRWWWGGGWKKGHSLIAWQSEWSFFSPFSMTCRLWVYTNEARQTKGVQRLGPSGFLVITIALFTNDAAVATKRALLSASWRDSRCPVDNGPMPLLFARFQETVVSLRLVGRRRRFFLPPRLHNLFFYHPSLRLFSRITFCIQNRALAVKTFFGNREFLFSLFPFSERGATRLFLHPTSIGWSSVGIWIVFFFGFCRRRCCADCGWRYLFRGLDMGQSTVVVRSLARCFHVLWFVPFLAAPRFSWVVWGDGR